jgi:hypothetical protein
MIPYLARLLDVTINNAILPSDSNKAVVVPIYKGGWPVAGLKLQTRQFNLGGLHPSATQVCESHVVLLTTKCL